MTFNKTIFITGTPCVGKTSLASSLFNELNKNYKVKLIKINEFAISNNLIIGNDPDKGYKIINIEKLDEYLQKDFENFFNQELDSSKIVIVEGHISHLCSNPDYVISLRLNPEILQNRLMDRNYSNEKINENLEAEALGICSQESYEIHKNKLNEIDCSNLNLDDLT
ncbi:adenylate kinase family protein, partial [Methanobrevibacter sp. OttesenSCG-928-I08]|nr:adenylate kinase family protein [Methanobrevibacter sp. OttesenSCG-928-I08]